MADNNQDFLDYMWDQFKDTFSPKRNLEKTEGVGSRVLRGINNTATQRDWGDENTTFSQAINGQIYPSNPNPVKADSLSIVTEQPQNTATLNEVAEQDVANGGIDINKVITSSTTPSQTGGPAIDSSDAIVNSDTFVDITKLEVEDMAKKHQEEKEIEDENWLETGWRWTKGRYNKQKDEDISRALGALVEANEKHMILAYDPSSRNVTELVINSPQGYSDDFRATLYNRGGNNPNIFDALYSEYIVDLSYIAYSDLSDEDKVKLSSQLFDAFYKEVNDQELLKAFENDHYTDGNILAGAVRGSIKANGRLDEKFTQEQLDIASKRKVEEGVYKPTKEEFADFLEMYGYNKQYKEDMTLDAYYGNSDRPEKNNISYSLTEESISQMQYAQVSKIMEPVRVELLKMEDEGKVTPVQRNEIMNSLMSQANDYISNMHFWLDTPLALYVSASNKDVGEQTWGERAIQGYGPGLQKLMEDYTDAVGRWLMETLKTVDKDGNVYAPDMIDGMSINDFFKDAIRDSNIQAGGWDLYSAESAIDAFQLINNNISFLYYSGKGNLLRNAWQNVQSVLGGVGYTAGELTSIGIDGYLQGADYLAGKAGLKVNANLSDYVLADRASALTVRSNTGAPSWVNPEFAKLVSRFSLGVLENGPEFAGEIAAMNWAFPNNLFKLKWALKNGTKVNEINQAIKGKQKLEKSLGVIGRLRKSINFPAQQNGRGWLIRMINGGLKTLEGENQVTKGIIEMGKNITKGAVSDQLIDALVSYYDTEPYSDASFLLSTGMTGISEILAPLVKDYQLTKRIGNFLNRREWSSGTAWRVMSYLNQDEKALNRLKALNGGRDIPLETYKLLGYYRNDVEDILKAALETLPNEVKSDIGNIGKQILFEQLRKRNSVDWESVYGRKLLGIINNKSTNAADVIKYMFGIPGQVQVGGFISKILLKNPGAALQTRLLKKDYDVLLDTVVDGGFRKRLKEGFTINDLKQIQKQTKYKELVKGGTPDGKLFQKEGDKYFLTSDGAKKFELDVSEYTESMRRADLRRASESETRQLLDEKTKQLMDNKGLSPEVVEKLASSGAFQKMVDDISTVVCKIK